MPSSRKLTIVQLNDSHGYLDLHQELFWEHGTEVFRPAGGFGRIATLVDRIRQSRGEILFADGGDTLHGTHPVVSTRGKAIIPIVNALGLAATTAHWEFAYGPTVFEERARALTYPVLAANVYGVVSGQRVFPSHVVREVAGLRVGLIGIASNIVDKTMPASFSQGLRFTLGRDELPAIVDQLRSRERVDLVVLVSHLGFPQDVKLVAEVTGIDVCLSAHTHNRLVHPVRQGQTLIVQSGCHGSFLGRLDLEIDRGIVDYQHALVEVAADVPPDPTVEALVRDALAPFPELAEVVGETATPLHRYAMLESTMDNLLLAAIQASTGAQLAFSNGWRYGAPIVTGPITLNDLYNIIPMNPPVSTVELRGDELCLMLEENLERTFAANPYDQMGGYVKRALGLTAYIKLENPRGQRIQKLFVGHEEVGPSTTYTTTFVTSQGVPPAYGRNRQENSERAIDALRRYLARHRPIRMALNGPFRVV